MLTDHLVFSSAVMFADAFRDYNVGTIVGYETGGTPSHYGYPRSFTLKNSGIDFGVSRVAGSVPGRSRPCPGICAGAHPPESREPAAVSVEADRRRYSPRGLQPSRNRIHRYQKSGQYALGIPGAFLPQRFPPGAQQRDLFTMQADQGMAANFDSLQQSGRRCCRLSPNRASRTARVRWYSSMIWPRTRARSAASARRADCPRPGFE